MAEEVRIPIQRESDIVLARQKGREIAGESGLSGTDQTMVALAISEIARNIVSYAGQGEIVLAPLHEGTRRGILVIGRDEGPGIANKELAMRDGYSTAKSLGVGLPGAKRVMDEFELESEPGKGTTVTMKKWSR